MKMKLARLSHRTLIGIHEYLQKHRADISWVGPLYLYSQLGHNDYLRMHREFGNSSDRLNYWLEILENKNESIARYVATADRLVDDYSFAETRDGYRYDRREMTIKLDIFDTHTKKRVWSGLTSRATKERRP